MSDSQIPDFTAERYNPLSVRCAREGYSLLKPIANQQVEASRTPQMLRVFMQLGERYPDITVEIYVVAGNPQQFQADNHGE